MKRTSTLLLTCLTAWLLTPGITLAQRGMGDPYGIGQMAVKPAVVSLVGTLQEIKTEPCAQTTGRSPLGTHLIVKDEAGTTYNVHLGPAAAVADSVKQLALGERLTLKVFRTDKLPAQSYIAQSLVAGKKEFAFRDANLRPVWASGPANRVGAASPSPANAAGDVEKSPDTAQPAAVRRGPGYGAGYGPGWGGRGWGARGQARGWRSTDAAFQADREVFHQLLADHERIRRTVTARPDGVEAVTESDDPAVATAIQKHAYAMHERLKNHQPIHMRDPLFAAIFANADKIKMEITKTAKGVRVVETSDDPQVVRLIQAHAEVVSMFVKNGLPEAWQDHPVPAAK